MAYPPIDERYSRNRETTSINRMTMPVVMAAAIGLAGAGAGAAYSSIVSKIESVPREINAKIETVTRDISQRIGFAETRVDRIENELDRRTQDRYTATDHSRWCRTAELVNTASGWKCPDLGTAQPRLEFAPRLQGWDQKK